MGGVVLAMTEESHDPTAAKLYARLQSRDRLQKMAAEARAVELTPQQREIGRLKEYLLMWAERQDLWGPKLKLKSHTSFADQPTNATSASEYYERSDAWARAVIDTSIGDLPELPDGDRMQAALRCRYLNEGLSMATGFQIRVLRMRRLEQLTVKEVDDLADRAELALIPIVKRRELPL
jgi:hypothetical protein